MKHLIKTYGNWRKLTSSVFLLLFSLSSILWTFPLEECNMACLEQVEMPKCCSEDMIEQSCCNMMESKKTNDLHSKRGEAALVNNNCELELIHANYDEYILPDNIQTNYELIELATIQIIEFEITTERVKNFAPYSLNCGPPIYIQISSYLI